MTIRAVFDGKTFVPMEPVSLPPQTEVDLSWRSDAERQAWMDRVNAETQADYANVPPDEEDDAWIRATERDLPKINDEADHDGDSPASR